jgi:hypothetical protein
MSGASAGNWCPQRCFAKSPRRAVATLLPHPVGRTPRRERFGADSTLRCADVTHRRALDRKRASRIRSCPRAPACRSWGEDERIGGVGAALVHESFYWSVPAAPGLAEI